MLTLKEALSEQELADSKEIERMIFDEEQGKNDAYAAFEAGDITRLIMYDGEKAVATGQLCFDGEYFMIGRVAVVSANRGNGLGDFVMRCLIRRAFDMGGEDVYINASEEVRGFFEKLGFKPVSKPLEKSFATRVLMKRSGDIGGNCGL